MSKFVYALSACVMMTSSVMGAPIPADKAPAADRYQARYPFADPLGIIDKPSCVKICDGDVYPCDPPDFKRADGRCSS